jgi:hypothetical protein
MAKSRKSDNAAAPGTPPAKSGPRKTAAKKGAKASGAGEPKAGGAPLIDTDLAAQAAARMLLARSAGAGAGKLPVGKESASFKQLKDSVGKPNVHSMDTLLNNTAPAGAKRQNLPTAGGRNQVGHNQTFGADVSRASVPRRTGG